MRLQGRSLTLRQARALIRHRVRERLAKYKVQDIWSTSFFVDRLDLAVEVFDCQTAQKPNGTVAEIDELIEIVREEFVDFVLLEDTRRRIKLLGKQQELVCEACSQVYGPSDYIRCPVCSYLNLFHVTEIELNSLTEQLELRADDPIARRALTETESWRVETSYLKIVTCFETFHRRLNELAFAEAGSPVVKLSRPNLFQNVQDAGDWFRQHHNLDLFKRLSSREVCSLDLVFNKRHVITHNGGIADRRYIQRTRGNPETIGEPITLSKQEILQAIGLVRRIVQVAREAFSKVEA